MKFKYAGLSIFIGVVMGALSVYVSYPYMMPLSENIAGKVLEKSKQSVEKVNKPMYPVGTFEYEHKRTI